LIEIPPDYTQALARFQLLGSLNGAGAYIVEMSRLVCSQDSITYYRGAGVDAENALNSNGVISF
jgi:hypothetical protein